MKALPDVKDAIGGVASDSTQLIKDGKTIAFGGAPNLGFSVDPSKPQFNSLTLVEGAWPAANEVVVDTSTASKKDLKVGSVIGVQVQGPVEQLRISGLVKFGSVSSIGGATLAGFDLATAQRLFGKVGQARPDPGRREPRRVAGEARGADPRDPAREHRGPHGRPRRRARTRRTPTSSSPSCAISCSRSD